MAGWIFIFFVLAHSVDSSLNPSLSGFAFYSITFRLSLRLTLRQAFPDEVLYKNTVWLLVTRRFPSVPDYGYSSWLIHPVSSTIFHSLKLSCNTCYSITFQSSIRFFRKRHLPERSSIKTIL
jgi:hypothetical protein